jgi:8-oxo-dGTP pyrophosphatase MutT (NUDIX family)
MKEPPACSALDRYGVDVAISPHIRRLREKVGHDLLVLPSVCVLPIDLAGRLLLVEAIDTGQWQTIGGAIEPHESPREAGVREALEEAGVVVELGRLVDALGGPGFEITYPNGDVVSYVSNVFEATVTSGVPNPDGDETSAVAWWALDDLGQAPLSSFTRLLFRSLPMRELLSPRSPERVVR